MKKYINILCFIIVFALSTRCSKDIGNYKYEQINEINITGVLEGDHDSERIYNLPFKQTLEINPTVEGTLSGGNHDDLIFEWKVDKKIISTDINLKYEAVEKYGKMAGEFVVTDKKTGFKKYYHFFVNVVNPNKLGYYILAKTANNESVLYCKSTIVTGSTFEKVFIPNFDLGKNPLTIGGSREYLFSATDYYNKLIIGVKNSATPVVLIDSREFIPVLYYTKDSFVGDHSTFKFEPTDILIDPTFPVIYVVNEGKIHILQKGGVDLPIFKKDPIDYVAGLGSLVATTTYGSRYFSFYDTKNKTMRLLDNTSSNVPYDFNKSYDDLTNPSLFANQKFITGCQTTIDLNPKMVYLMLEGQMLKSYKVNYSAARIPLTIDKVAENTIPGDGILRQALYDNKSNFWYLATSKAIYRSSHLGLEFQLFVELPQESKGHISKFKFLNSRLMIGTYDSQFEGDKKCSVYIFNTNNMNQIYFEENVSEEIVDMHVGT